MTCTTLISSGLKLGTTPKVVPLRQHHRPTPFYWLSPSQPPTSISLLRSSPRSVDFEKYILKKNKHVSKLDLEKLLDTYNNDHDIVTMMVENLEYRREFVKRRGRHHFEAGPMVEVISTTISPHNVHLSKPLAIYGRIYLEFHHILDGETETLDLFNRGPDDPEILGSSRSLPLTSPNDAILTSYLCIPLHETKLVVDLWDAHHNVVFVQDCFFVSDATKDDYEQLHLKHIHGTSGSIVVRYLSMLFGILCHVEVRFFHLEGSQDKGNNTQRVVNIYGEIVARYGNTHGNYVDDEFILFRKSPHEFKQVVAGDRIEPNIIMRLPRCWLRMPPYATLIVDLNLFDFNTKKPFFKGVAEFVPDFLQCSEAFRVDDIVMDVVAYWKIHKPGRGKIVDVSEEEEEDVFEEEEEEDDEEEDEKEEEEEDEQEEEEEDEQEEDEDEEEEEDDDDDEEISRWIHYNIELGLYGGPALEVFSIFIGWQKTLKSLRLYGTIEVDSAFYLFRRDKEDAFELSERSRFLPIPDGSRMLSILSVPIINFDLKDVDGNLFIKGYIKWDQQMLHFTPRSDSQLCSVIQGDHGFVSVQYTFFDHSYHINVEVSYKLKKGGSYGVYGSLFAEYDSYYYSSRFQKDFYRIVFFERDEQDMLTLGTMDGKIPLLRSTLVVPAAYYHCTTLITNANLEMVDLSSGVTRGLSHVVEVEIGEDVSSSMETEDCVIEICFKWMTQKQMEMSN